MEQFITKLLTDFGITGGLYILIILGFMYYIPKLVNKHFETIDNLVEKHQQDIEKIIASFEKQVEASNSWHIQHDKNLVEIKTDLKDIKFKIYNIKNEKN